MIKPTGRSDGDDDTKSQVQVLPASQERQRAEVEVMVTHGVGFRAKVDLTTGGLLSITALVTGILLSTAVIVDVATRHKNRLWP
jgi:hypothetical protein